MTCLCPWQLLAAPELREIAVRFIISFWLLLNRVAFFTANYLRHTPAILFYCTSSIAFVFCILHWPSELTAHFLIGNTLQISFFTSSLTLTDKFNKRLFSSHVNSMLVDYLVKQLSKRNKNLKLKSKSIVTKNNAKRQSWCHEFHGK